LVGAGPGDPGLITRRGEALLARADIVVYDHLAGVNLLELAPPEAVRIEAGKSIGHCVLRQDEINEILVTQARAGKTVVRLKGGDPLIFGRGGEEAQALHAAGIPFEIVPGVTAGVGVPAYAGIAVTQRAAASAVAFVTGHADPEAESEQEPGRLDWQALARFPGTLVVYMGATHLAAICRTLIRLGKSGDTPAAVIQSGTTASQRTLVATLERMATATVRSAFRPPALLVVGSVVDLRSELAWYESLPLFGQRIVVTRPRHESIRAAAHLEALGAEVLLAPCVEIQPVADPGPLDLAIDNLGAYDWLVFTSATGVRFFMKRLDDRGSDLRALGSVKLAAIGPETARALAQFHLRADLIPHTFRSESLAEAVGRVAGGGNVLLARADRGRTILKDELARLAKVDQVAVYHQADCDALPEPVLARIADGSVDWITLTSSAITARLHQLLPERDRLRIGREIRLASLSPVTTQSAANLGWHVAAEAAEYTWDGLVQALVTSTRASSQLPATAGTPRP
jgi:uroporphyrinogen III methyltransferase / synthase